MKDNTGISQRLKMLRHERGLTGEEVAAALHVATSTYRRWEIGSNNPKNKLSELAKFFDVSTDFLIDGKEAYTKKQQKIVRVPVLGQVAAGIPIEAIQDVEDWEEIVRPEVDNDFYFALRIHGDSMEPRLYEGDKVILKKQECFDDGDMCVVLVDTAATVKIVNKHPDGILLRGYNEAAYRPHFYTARQVQEIPIKILGVVIELRCKP